MTWSVWGQVGTGGVVMLLGISLKGCAWRVCFSLKKRVVVPLERKNGEKTDRDREKSAYQSIPSSHSLQHWFGSTMMREIMDQESEEHFFMRITHWDPQGTSVAAVEPREQVRLELESHRLCTSLGP